MRDGPGVGEPTADPEAAPPSDFEATIAEARRGSAAALDALRRHLAPSVLAFLRARLPTGAEHLAANVWAEAARRLSRFRGDEAAFRAWVFTIAHKRLGRELRRRGDAGTGPAPTVADTSDDAVDPAEQAMDALAPTAAAGRLAHLPPRHADVLLLRVVGRLSVEQTAFVLGRSPAKIRSMQRRAVEYLAGQLGAQGDG